MCKLSERLREFRKKHKLNQDVMAEKCKVSTRSYCHYEAGERSPDADFFTNLASKFGVDAANYILFGTVNLQKSAEISEPPVNPVVFNKKRLEKLVDDLPPEDLADLVKLAEDKKQKNDYRNEIEELKRRLG